MSTRVLQGDPDIALTLRRSARARRMTLRINQIDGRVTLTLPTRASEREAVAFVEEKQAWIRKHLDASVGHVSVGLGARIPVEGMLCDVVPGTGRRVSFEDGALYVPGAEDHAPARVLGYLKTLDSSPGVYRMLDRESRVLYVGKARNLRARVSNYSRHSAQHSPRIARMISMTASMMFLTTRTETEALLLEQNLIKQLKPKFNVLLRDDKSFPNILETGDHPFAMIKKHRGAKKEKGAYYGPFASAGAVNRTLNQLQRVFLLRNCNSSFLSGRIDYKSVQTNIEANFRSMIFIRDPVYELAERLRMFKAIFRTRSPIMNDRDLLFYKPAIDYFSELDFRDKRMLKAAFKNLPDNVANLLHSPIVRQLVSNNPVQLAGDQHLSQALDNLANFEIVGCSGFEEFYAKALCDLMANAEPGNEAFLTRSLARNEQTQQVAEWLFEIKPALKLLDLDTILFHEVKYALKSTLTEHNKKTIEASELVSAAPIVPDVDETGSGRDTIE